MVAPRFAGWWIVHIDGHLVGGFVSRDVARAIVKVVPYRTSYSISIKSQEA